VDFSCLFDRGLLLDKPEVVPFRLTQVSNETFLDSIFLELGGY
jgi:hypothetical protein